MNQDKLEFLITLLNQAGFRVEQVQESFRQMIVVQAPQTGMELDKIVRLSKADFYRPQPGTSPKGNRGPIRPDVVMMGTRNRRSRR